MGNCFSTSLDKNTKYINKRLEEEHSKDKQLNKLLFLGPGASGKSTIFKQLQWLHGGGFTKADISILKSHIYLQSISQMRIAIHHYVSNEDQVNDDILTQQISIVQNNEDDTILTNELADAIHYIWIHIPSIKNAFTTELQTKILDDTTEYFWDQIHRIKVEGYIPTETDIVKVRYKTTEVTQKSFAINGCKFEIYDVGGQKSERKKWISFFNEVNALVFVVSLSCYNEMMQEDKTKNAMVDSLELFASTINNKYFTKTHIILFLNKKDLFENKMKKVPITICPAFSDFDDESVMDVDADDYLQTACYISSKFEALNEYKEKKVYTHLTCAMNQKNIDAVFSDVMGIIISKNLTGGGLIQ